MTEFSGRVYTLPGGRRDCAMRLLLRICRRTGILGGTKGAPLMKNAVPFYRSQSAILRLTEPIPDSCVSSLEGRLTKETFKFKSTSPPPELGLPGCCEGLDEQPNFL